MRTKHSILNISSNFIITLSKTILTFIVRTIFIKILGSEVLGLNGLLTNVLSMLSLAELGVSTAINFSLYKPLAQNDTKKISVLMSFYKRTYRIIGIIIAIIGIILMFFLKYIIKDAHSINNLNIIYILFLINTVATYFVSYKETLINADQKFYKLTFINFLFTTLMYILQIIFLLVTKNYIIYLIIQFATELVKRIIINRYITKKYNNIDFSLKEKLDSEDKNTLVTNVKAMFFHKIGDYCINSTDNLIISKMIGIGIVGIYSNYLTIIHMVNTFTTLIYNSMIASFGNLIATEDKSKGLEVFKKINFIGFIIYGVSSLLFLNLFNTFISLWIGENYLLDINTVIVIVINFYLTGMRVPISTIKSAAGIYDQDKYTPIIQSVINLIFSIVLAKYYGIIGVILGTLISSILPCIQRPHIVYKYVFNKTAKEYFKEYIKYIITILIIEIISILLFNIIPIKSQIISLILRLIITIIISIIIITLFFRKTIEFQYVLDFIKKITERIFRKWKKV